MKYLFTAAVSLILLVACAPQQQAQERPADSFTTQTERGRYETIPVAQAQSLIQTTSDLQVLDVRTAEEFAGGHLQKAVPLDFYAPDFQERLNQLDKQKPYLIYCQSGRRSAKTLDLMKAAGFARVYELAGGFLAWQAAGAAVEK